MSKTKDQVKKHCAEILGLKTVGQDITQPWTTKLNEFWDAVYDELKHENINIFASAGPLPDKLYHHMAVLMADMGKTALSVSEPRYQRITIEKLEAWREIRKFAMDRYESIDGPTDY
jgi:hypothetical protein